MTCLVWLRVRMVGEEGSRDGLMNAVDGSGEQIVRSQSWEALGKGAVVVDDFSVGEYLC